MNTKPEIRNKPLSYETIWASDEIVTGAENLDVCMGCPFFDAAKYHCALAGECEKLIAAIDERNRNQESEVRSKE